MSSELCPVCRVRRGKRDCPALGQEICAVCCGTKRQTEINCPPSCGYLSSARAHPAAAVQRRRERDYRFVLPLVAELSDQQYRLMLAFQAVTLKHSSTVVPAPNDADVHEAAATVASTLETSQKGIIYEHQAASVPAQRLAGEFRAMLAEIEREGRVRGLERDAVVVLRRIEHATGQAARAFPEDGGRAYLALLARIMSGMAEQRGQQADGEPSPSGLIIPP